MREVESVLEPIIDAVRLDGKDVIDVGCGTGEVARALSERGARVIGIDRPAGVVPGDSSAQFGRGSRRARRDEVTSADAESWRSPF